MCFAQSEMPTKKETMHGLTQFCTESLQEVERLGLRRALREVDGMHPVEVYDGEKTFISFAGNDYLGLRHHPAVIRAGQQALYRYGAGAGASRLVTGNHPLYAPLEARLAALKGQTGALVFGSGYLTNFGTIAALMGEGDLILADKLVHACILDGAQLSGAELKRFRHNDTRHAETLLRQSRGSYRHALIVTEHIFSMDGDCAPIASLVALAREYDAWLMVDDAHGLVSAPAASEEGVDIWSGTLSKALGSYGGYIAAAAPVTDYILNNARSFIFSTGLPPAACATALAALEVLDAEPQRRERPLELAWRVTDAFRLPRVASAIVPIIVGGAKAAVELSKRLKGQGIIVSAIRPPTVPPQTARLRLTFSYAHTDQHVDALIDALKTALGEMNLTLKSGAAAEYA